MLASSRLATSSRTLATRSGGTPSRRASAMRVATQQRVARLGDPARRRRAVKVIKRAELIDRQPFHQVLLQQQPVRAVQRRDRLGERRLEVRHVLALQELQLGVALRLRQHGDQLVAHRDLGRLVVSAAAVDERARRGDADPVLQEPLTGVRRDARARARRARRASAAAGIVNSFARSSWIRSSACSPGRSKRLRDARDLVAVQRVRTVPARRRCRARTRDAR